MRSRISNPIVVGLLVLVSGCYLRHEKGQSTEDDDPSPSGNGSGSSVVVDIPTAVGGGSTATGGNPSIDVGRPLVDVGIEGASLLGFWRGRVRFVFAVDDDVDVFGLDDVDGSDHSAVADGFGLEFTETEMVLSYGDIEIYEFSYSIDRYVTPHQLEIKLESVKSNLIPNSERIDYESTSFFIESSIIRIENDELTITMPIVPPPEGAPPTAPALDPRINKLTMIFELTRV